MNSGRRRGQRRQGLRAVGVVPCKERREREESDVKAPPTPRESVETLRTFAISDGCPQAIMGAIGALLDHVTRVEQTLSLVLLAMDSVARDRPAFAVMRDGSDPSVPHTRKEP
jgi:hypothetical protein